MSNAMHPVLCMLENSLKEIKEAREAMPGIHPLTAYTEGYRRLQLVEETLQSAITEVKRIPI